MRRTLRSAPVCLSLALCLPLPGAALAQGALRAAHLRAESKVDPLGIDVLEPRLSWIVESDRRAERQTAYRVLVASSAEALGEDRGDLWDSGKVASDETTGVAYAGKPLASGQLCRWKVMVWDRDGRPSAWSAPALWSMGLLRAEDWKAAWIGFDRPLAEKVSVASLRLPPPRYLRKGFSLTKPVRRATAYASALGLYELRLNGRRVGNDWFTPGWTDYDKRVYYQTYDVTGLVQQGDNAVAAVIADGWYAGYLGFGGERDHYGTRIRLLAQLEIEHADGSKTVVASGPDWKASTGPLLEADFLMGEAFDARRAMPGWDDAGFDDAGWSAADVTPRIAALVQAHPGPPVRELEPLRPVAITEPAKGRFVFDLGQNFAGVARLRVRGAASGQEITLRHAEVLNPDGTIYTTNLRSARATDRYIAAGRGEETWEPRFTFHGFRYVEVSGYPGRPGEDAVAGIPLSSTTPAAGSFRCSNPMLDKLFSNISWTQRMNFIDVPTDCPQRDERLGWTGDAQIYIRAACMIADTQAFYTKWLADLADAQRADGSFPMVAPLKSKGVSGDGGPAWADAGVICPWTVYDVYGDRRVLERHYEGMRRYVEFTRKRCNPELLPPDKFHCFGDWLNIGDNTPTDVIFMAYFAHSAALVARAAEALGKPGDAQEMRGLFERVRESFAVAYVSPEGRVQGDTQTGYALALQFDLLDGERRERAARRLIELIEGKGWRLSTGFIGTKDLMLVLSRIGREDVAFRLLESTAFPSWGFSIQHGATTIWERWDGWTPEKGFQDAGMNSFAHYSFGAVYQWICENVGGIRTEGPGFKRLTIRPRPGGSLSWARTSYRSIRGEVATDWSQQGAVFRLSVTVPANVTAVVHVPAVDPKAVLEGGKPASEAEGVRLVEAGEGEAVFEVGSGPYELTSRIAR
ncbi:MAG: glycoside hydrolase family 78 protein [Planctomycetes bacterium]|nr:glycoside hydrolase family 78 protein [Planctomycetota bacterium]